MTRDIEQLDKQLYKYWYFVPRENEVKKIWDYILINPKLQKEAITIVKDTNELNTVKAPTICHRMLMYYQNVNTEIYQELIQEIYSDIDIARTAVEGDKISGGLSFLLLSLKNNSLKLTEAQKAYAVDEALNKGDSKRSQEQILAFKKELEKNNINDFQADPSKLTITEKMRLNLQYCMNKIALNSNIHGYTPFDIRYYILKNPNWTIEEKKSLIKEFWYSEEIFQDYLNAWEETVFDSIYTFTELCEDETTKEELLSLEYDQLLKLTHNKEYISLLIIEDLTALKEIYKLKDTSPELLLKPKNE